MIRKLRNDFDTDHWQSASRDGNRFHENAWKRKFPWHPSVNIHNILKLFGILLGDISDGIGDNVIQFIFEKTSKSVRMVRLQLQFREGDRLGLNLYRLSGERWPQYPSNQGISNGI
jgi:hypothetical protein